MSQGTRIYSVRLPKDLVELAEATIRMRGLGRTGAQWSLSDFVRIALAEKIRKMDRCRKRTIRSIMDEARSAFLAKVQHNEDCSLEEQVDDVRQAHKSEE